MKRKVVNAGVAMKSVVMPLIVINVILFILQIALGDWFTEFFVLRKFDTFLRPWTLLTSMFLHGSPSHLFFNMYGLLLFGPLLESRIGPKRFLFIYLLSGLLAALVSSFIYPAALGASGAIMGMLGVLIILMPDLQLLLFFAIPMSLRTAGIMWIVIDVMGAFNPMSGVANVAHLVGVGCGLVYGRIMLKKRKKTSRKLSGKTFMDENDVDEWLRNGRL